MSIYTASLNSGSNGNCYYAGNRNEAVLIDVGISCRELEKRMQRIGLNIQKIKAIFISHEHTDHISGVQTTSKKYNIPVYINDKTIGNSRLQIKSELRRDFNAHTPIQIGDIEITAFPKNHDAADPYSFIVKHEETTLGVMTDIGEPCSHVKNYFNQCNAVYLEANYDEDMLMNGHYPYYLKKRISASHGHLSNKQALDLFLEHKNNSLSHIFLSHLSKENNDPTLVKELFSKHSGNTHISVASRLNESEVFHITGDLEEHLTIGKQASLF